MGDTFNEALPTPIIPMSPILRLPNELLSKIFSYLLTTSTKDYTSSNQASVAKESPPHHHPILTLRQVCHRFRKVTNKSQFWYNDDFDFSQLMSHGGYANRQFVSSLLTDRDLAHCIGRKTTWTFRTYKRFAIILARVPLVRQRASTMRFFWSWRKNGRYATTDKTTFSSLVDTLALCRGLRVLQLFDVPEVNFDNIAKSFLALEVLAVEYRWYKGDREWVGSLQGLCGLQRLSLINLGCRKRRQSEEEDGKEKGVEMLPSGSVVSLTHLQLIGDGTDINTFTQSLDTFVNITHLSLVHIANETIDRIVRADFRLIDLKIKVWSGMQGTMEPMRLLLSSPALHSLQSLELSFRGDAGWFSQRTYLVTVDSITARLKSLHHLKFRMPLYLSMCRQFNQLSNLKSIVWVAPMIIDDIDRHAFDDTEKAVRCFEDVFTSFEEKPSVDITIEDPDYDDVYDFDPLKESNFDGPCPEIIPVIIGTGQVSQRGF